MTNKIKKIALTFYLIIVSLSVLVFLQIAYYSFALPDNFYRSDKSDFSLSSAFPIIAKNSPKSAVAAGVYENEQSSMQLYLYGIVPIKSVTVLQTEAPMLTPLGQPFGLKILTDGVIVTDYGMVDATEGRCSPAEKGGVEIGDIIISANGIPVASADELLKAVQKNPRCATLVVIRNNEEITLRLTPFKSNQDGLYKLGMWTKDSCAGIGTLTFYDSERKVYGGLGHSVCDIDTGQLLPLASGEAVPVDISEVTKGCQGSPGELCGNFLPQIRTGAIEINTQCGVFGIMEKCPSSSASVPMAFKQEVEIGEAKILTTIKGTQPEEYDIIIEKINYNSASEVKNMVIRITDSRLLSEAGGIAQGMSGSPIIQNGKLVGAVTHVFVNEINRGYGIFAENMYRTSLSVSGTDTALQQVG